MTTTQTPRVERLIDTLMDKGVGESQPAYMAKRLAVGVARQTLADDLIDRMADMSNLELDGLITRLQRREATIYDLPRQIIYCLGRTFPRSRGRRALAL